MSGVSHVSWGTWVSFKREAARGSVSVRLSDLDEIGASAGCESSAGVSFRKVRGAIR